MKSLRNPLKPNTEFYFLQVQETRGKTMDGSSSGTCPRVPSTVLIQTPTGEIIPFCLLVNYSGHLLFDLLVPFKDVTNIVF